MPDYPFFITVPLRLVGILAGLFTVFFVGQPATMWFDRQVLGNDAAIISLPSLLAAAFVGGLVIAGLITLILEGDPNQSDDPAKAALRKQRHAQLLTLLAFPLGAGYIAAPHLAWTDRLFRQPLSDPSAAGGLTDMGWAVSLLGGLTILFGVIELLRSVRRPTRS